MKNFKLLRHNGENRVGRRVDEMLKNDRNFAMNTQNISHKFISLVRTFFHAFFGSTEAKRPPPKTQRQSSVGGPFVLSNVPSVEVR